MKAGEVWKIKSDSPGYGVWAEDKIMLVGYLGSDLWEIKVMDYSGVCWNPNEVITGEDLYKHFYKCEDQSWPEFQKHRGC